MDSSSLSSNEIKDKRALIFKLKKKSLNGICHLHSMADRSLPILKFYNGVWNVEQNV